MSVGYSDRIYTYCGRWQHRPSVVGICTGTNTQTLFETLARMSADFLNEDISIHT